MATPTDNSVPLTGNPLLDGLTWGAAWRFDGGPQVLAYSLSLNDNPNGGSWTPALSDAARRALTEWSNVANLGFVEIGGGEVYDQSPADLAFILTGNEMQTRMPGLVGLGLPPSPSLADSILGGASRADYPQPEGDIALDNYYGGFSHLDSGGVGLTIILHEIGHALGLKHTDDAHDGRPTFASLGISNLDSQRYTVMSYTDALGQPLGSNQYQGNAATPMPLDILAMQQIYGANTSFHTGDDTYVIDPAGVFASARTIWDAGGNDTLSFRTDGYSDGTIDLREGHYSGISGHQVAIAYGVVIESAVGGNYGDTLIGNFADNRLDGGAGNDTMAGGAGNDTYAVDAVGDVVTEQTGEGTDTIVSSVDFTLPGNVENLTLSGSARIDGAGNGLDNILTGNAAGNHLTGGAGNDHLDGGGGVDTLAGGAGDDVYMVSATLAGPPNALELSGEPGAYVFSGTRSDALLQAPYFDLRDYTHDGWIDYVDIYSMGQNPGFLLRIGTNQLGQNLAAGDYPDAQRAPFAAAGHAGLDLAYDGRGSNQVFGSFSIAAIDIDYSGGTPLLQSLALTFELHSESPTAPATFGSFNYNHFDGTATPDLVVELAGEGYDEVRTGVSWTLTENVEKLTLTGSAAIAGTGNALDNVLIGNSGDNSLDGAGGNDTLIGGAGDDNIILTLAGAVNGGIIDGGGGNDTITLQGPGWANLSSLDVFLDRANGTIAGPGFSFSVTNVENLSIDIGEALSIANWHVAVPGALMVDAEDITISGGSTLTAGQNQLITTTGDITITGGNLSAGQGQFVTAGGSITVGGTGAMLLVSSPTASVTLTAGNLALNGQLNIYSDYSSASVTLAAGSIVGTNDVSVTASNGGSLVLSHLDGFVGPQLVTLDGSLVGTSHADKLTGYASHDMVIGGPGNDTIDGGAGQDTARYSGHSDDYTITQGAWYHYTITDNNPADGDDGVDAVFGVEQLQFADSLESLQTAASWHGFRHKPVTPLWANTDWQVLEGQRDLDGDGRNDVLLQKPDGSVALWLMDGAERIAGAIFEPSPGRHLIDSTTDYNGDGKTDLGWREADGSNSYWLMGSGWMAPGAAPAVTPPVTPPSEPVPPPPTVPVPPPPDGWWF
ncbi:MAG: M10 family metallopeptidase C-terminal domain-containing protein [Sulfuritalea sp.]|nr:M10 family metallopeptidase C-terminal domain-containing protein [Sulfuritalea sp.]